MKRIWILAMAMLLIVPAVAGIASASDHHENSVSKYIGGFVYTDGVVSGEYVSFSVNPKNGEIWNYTVNNVTVFDHIYYEKENIGKIRVTGPTFMYMGMGYGMDEWDKRNMSFEAEWKFIHAHDNPTGVLHIVIHGGDAVTYELAEGINATQVNSTIVLNGIIDARLLISNGEISIENKLITVKTMNNATTSIVFVEPKRWMMEEKIKDMFMKEIQKGKVGTEMYIGENNCDLINYSYEMKAQIMHQEKNQLKLKVSAENPEGRVLILHMDKSMLEYDAQHRIRVRIDGENITEVNVDAVMDDNTNAKYAVVDNGDSVTVMVYIPHFSEHTVEVESEPVEGGEGSGVLMENPLIIALVLAIIIGAIGAVLWKTKSR